MADGPYSNPRNTDPKKPEQEFDANLDKLWRKRRRITPAYLLKSGLQTIINVVRKGNAG